VFAYMHIICIYANSGQVESLVTLRKMTVDWKTVGRRLRELRGFDRNQGEFAREIGISQSQLSRYENGTSEISAEVLLRIARRTGKSMEWLLTGKER
jgi:plasmid maintenance system antidote protein VapI